MRKSTLHFYATGLLLSVTSILWADVKASWNAEITPGSSESVLSSNAEPDLQSGLVAFYPFEGNANDVSGNEHHTTVLGAKPVSDRYGNPNSAYLFTGRKNSLQFEGSRIKSPVSTLTFWTKSGKKTVNTLTLNLIPGKLSIKVRKVNHKFEAEFSFLNKKVYIKDPNAYPDPDAFNFISLYYDGKKVVFGVNNKPVGSLKIDKTLFRGFFPYTLKNNPTFCSNAVLDEIRIYSRALGRQELGTLFNGVTSTIPELSYETHIKIAVDSAQIYRTVLSDGGSPISEMGVCWNTTGNPDTSDNKTSVAGRTGIYKTIMTNLLPNTRYYVRAYAVNKMGIAYSTEDFKFTTLPNLDYGTITDVDGNIYRTVSIGNQTWMAENLRTTHYADGTPIPEGTNLLSESGKFYYTFLGDTMHKEIYGLLYSWEGATNSNPGQVYLTGTMGACPSGWHIPSYAEKEALLNYLGGTVDAVLKLKEADEAHWDAPNESTNESGFTALGSGVKALEEGYGVFVDYRNLTYFWTSESYSNNVPENPIYFAPVLQVNGSDSHYWSPALDYGAPVRCVKDNSNQYVTIPQILTSEITDITSTSAAGGGSIVSDGGQFLIVRGLCWSTNPSPDTSDLKTMGSSYWTTFADNITGLSPNTLYYARAYGITPAGISYGNEVSFTTSSASMNSAVQPNQQQELLLSSPQVEVVAPDFYPNPAKSVIYFRNLTENAAVTIYDSHGKKLKDVTLSNFTLDVGSLSNGIYYLKIKDNEKITIKKLIKQ